jgi:hypothetical protein
MWQPDDFPGNPYGELTNQLGHMVLGMVLSLAFVPALAVPVIVGAAYWVVWEAAVQRLTLWADVLNDTANVMGGAAVMTAALTGDKMTVLGCFAALGLSLLVGVLRRMR